MIFRICVLLLLATPVSYAQLPNVAFEFITDRDGLPSREVECAVEDNQGFMWFGTRKCLVRYDGYSFQSIVDERIHGVAADKAGNIYCSTNAEKLVRVDAHSFTGKTLVGPEEGGAYHTFADSFGQVWFSDRDSISRYDPATRRTHRYPMTKTSYRFNKGSFAEDSQRNVWVLGMEVGLFRFDREANKLVCELGMDCPRTNPDDPLEFRRGFIDQDDILWVATVDQGMLRYDTKTRLSKMYSYPNVKFLTVCGGTDEHGKRIVWVGSDAGLGIFRPETGEFAFFDNLIPEPYQVFDIVQSRRTGILWVCTTAGLLKYDPRNQFIKTNFLPAKNQPVNAILKDKSDPTGQTFWLAVGFRGLYRWNRATNKTTFFEFPKYSNSLEVNWLIQGQDNTLWVGCNQWKHGPGNQPDPSDNRFEGIFRFDPAAGKYLPTPFTRHHTFFFRSLLFRGDDGPERPFLVGQQLRECPRT